MTWEQRRACRNTHAQWGTLRKDLVFEGHHSLVITCRNGTHQVQLECSTCGKRSGPLPKSQWSAAILGCATVVTQDNRTNSHYPACTVIGCPEPGMEHHHFAPVNTFGRTEANRWPVLPLCKAHHRAWHQQMHGYRFNAKGIDAA